MKPEIVKREKQLQHEFKEKLKLKTSHLGNHLSKPLPSLVNKTSTQNPSYIHPQRQTYLQMRQNLHLIVNKATFMSLRKQTKTPTLKSTEEQEKPKSHKLNPKQMLNTVVGKQSTTEVHNIKVMGCLPNQNNLAQLWAFIADELHDEMFYIFNVESNLAIKVENDKVVLAPKQKTKDFMFCIPKDTDKTKSVYRDALNIISSLNGKSLSLKGVLILTETNTKDECQLFYIKKVGLYEPKPLGNTYILFNPQDKQKQKAFLSVGKEKQELCYHKNEYSLYQRWMFSPIPQALDRNKKKKDHAQRQEEKPIRLKANEHNFKLEQLNEASINIVTKTAKTLVEESDDGCCEIINYKLEATLIVKEEKGQEKLALVPKTEKREWKLECDGFSIKIKHVRTEKYLGVRDQQIELNQKPKYWQVFESSKMLLKLTVEWEYQGALLMRKTKITDLSMNL